MSIKELTNNKKYDKLLMNIEKINDMNTNRLKRDYIKEPLKKISINTPTGYTYEKPYKEDLVYLYIECNWTTKQLQEYFNLTRRIIQRFLSIYGIKKGKEKRLENSIKTISNKTIDEKHNSILKAQQTKLERYGDKNYNNRKKSLDTCLERYGVNNVNRIHISPDVIKILENKELFKEYIIKNQILNATELSNKLNMSEPQIARYVIKYDLKYLFDYTKSSIEKEIKNIVSQYYKIEANVKIPNTNLEMDIYIPELKLGIEINGNYWHNEYNKEKTYHLNKSNLATNNGIFIYHIFEYEWKSMKGKILNQLLNLLKVNQTLIGARKCVIKEVANEEKSLFLENNHLQGNDSSSIKLGLYYNNELVSLMTFCKPRFNKKYEYELSRFCSKAGTNVMGGASKLWNYFIKTYNPSSVISYSNIAHTKGNLYQLLGFKMINISLPDYVWLKSNKVLSRYQCQKHKLLEQGYTGNSENEIMHNLGYYKIYDCGNKVWIWK